jgi:threonine dehydrogenase-like Zn-dependent dehydrogenase
MGAKVIAMGRNPDVLKKLTAISERVHVVPITGDAQADADALQRLGIIDAVFDMSSPMAGKSTHLKSGILAVRPGGRVSLMGGVPGDVLIPYMAVMTKSLQLKGKMMYDRDAARALIRLVESGVLKLGDSIGATVAGTFALDDWDAAFTVAEKHGSVGVSVLIAP